MVERELPETQVTINCLRSQKQRKLKRQERKEKFQEWREDYDLEEWFLCDDHIVKSLSRVVLAFAGILVLLYILGETASLINDYISPWANLIWCIPVIIAWIYWALKPSK